MPAQKSMIPGGRFTSTQVERQEPANGTFALVRPGVLQQRQQIPAFCGMQAELGSHRQAGGGVRR